MEQHQWMVDGIEEFVAAIEVDGGATIRVPQWLLPEAARAGQVLRVRHERPAGGARSVLTIEIDEGATREALARSAAQVSAGARASAARDRGGNIAL